MRILLLSLIAVCALLLISIYLFLPAKVTFSKVIVIKTKINIANRFLMDESKWGKWFPREVFDNLPALSDRNAYGYQNHFYSIDRKMMNTAEISISNNKIALKSLINMISIHGESVAIEWKSELPESSNPINRIKNYIKAKKLQRNMTDILEHLKAFLGENKKVYGIDIHEIISKDSTLTATKLISKDYPSTPELYNLIGRLKKYIKSQGAKENNFPMLHVKKVNDTTFETMVAIPVNKYLPGDDKIFFKRFVPWKVLTAEVRGGTHTVNEALHQMEVYISDYHREAMAIPFESLVTDRSKQPDTTQWITRIYTPVR
jgi:hypothetical protein